MKIAKIYQDQLLNGLNSVSKAVGSTTLAILNNILMTFTEKGLILFATDLEIGIETVVATEQSEKFSTTIPAKIFADLVTTMPGQLIELSYDEDSDNMLVKGTKSKHNIKCISAKDYPKPRIEKVKESFSFDTSLFKATISRVLFSASEEGDSKPVLASVIFAVRKDNVVIYATDGFRASLRDIPNPKGTEYEEATVIVPSSIVAEAAKIVSGDKVTFSLAPNMVTMKSGKTTIYGQLIEGNAPDYNMIQELIGSIKATSIKMNTAEFANLCKQADIFSSKEESKRLLLDVDLDGATVSGEAQQIGNSSGKIIAPVIGVATKIQLSSAYIREFLEASKCATITLCLEDSRKPVVFFIDELPGYWHMLMPVV